MSTYNGESYLREQIESILNQKHNDICLLIRDDGSADGTVSIIKEYADNYRNISYYVGENLGAKRSFLDLMKHADMRADYYALSDQDDVWLPNKIVRAIKLLKSKKKNIPLLYASKTILVDEFLTKIPLKIRRYAVKPSLGNALVENICTGCTEVFNNQLLQLVNRGVPEHEVMHDWWLYLIASAYGEVIYDDHSEILYRQHGNNSVGARSNWLSEIQVRFKNFSKSNGAIRKQAMNFRRIFGNDYPDSQLTDWVADYKKNYKYRLKLIFSSRVHRQGKIDDLIFRFLFLLGLR